MRIRFYPPHPRLAPWVAHLWTVESDSAYTSDDLRTVLPNGRMKLVFPYRGGLLNGPVGGSGLQRNRENSLWVLGISDLPWVVDHEGAFGTLAAEFHPGGAYRFFPFPLNDAQNRVVEAQAVFGVWGRDWEDRLAEQPTPDAKAALLQQLLLDLLRTNDDADPVIDAAVHLLRARKGLMTVGELTRRMGYSQRWLAAKFVEKVGLSPKTLAEILRFQNQFGFLSRWGGRVDFDGYFDQAHFTRQFKRFAGLPPAAYARARNEFANLFQTASVSYNHP